MAGLKEKMHAKFEREVIKMNVNEETVYLKKVGIFFKDWQRVYPPVNEDNTWNLSNLFFGGYRNLIKLLTILLILAFAFYGIYQMIHQMQVNTDRLCQHYVLTLDPADNLDRAICKMKLIVTAQDRQALNITGLNTNLITPTE